MIKKWIGIFTTKWLNLEKNVASKIIEGYGTDYQVRMYVKRSVLSEFMATTVLEMDYRNFKNKASKEASYLHGKNLF